MTMTLIDINNAMPIRGEGDGMSSRAGRADTAKRSASRRADFFCRNRMSATLLIGGVGVMGNRAKNTSARMCPSIKSSRKYAHITSTVSKFMITGISEPRRFRSLPVVEVHVPCQKINTKFAHITSTIPEFLKTGISKPRRLPMLPLQENAGGSCKPLTNSSRKFKHITSTVSKFMETGIAEPRRYRSVPVAEEVHLPVTNKSKKYGHVTSGVREYIRTGIFPPRRYTKFPLPDPTPLRNKNNQIRQVKSSTEDGIRMPPEQNFESNPKLVRDVRKTVPEPKEYPQNIGVFQKIERVDEIIANLVRQLKNVNGEPQPTEQTKLAAELTPDLSSKLPNYCELINSEDPFDLVYALGLGYHYKFISDFNK